MDWDYIRKRPWLFGGLIVLGIIIWMVLNGGSSNRSSSGGAFAVVPSGPSEAFQAQAMAVASQDRQAGLAFQAQAMAIQAQENQSVLAAQLRSQEVGAATQLERERATLSLEALTRQIDGQAALAGLQMQQNLAELQTSRAITQDQLAASLGALNSQLSFSLATTRENNRAAIDMTRIAQENATTQVAINAALQRGLSQDAASLTRQLSQDQIRALAIQTQGAVDMRTLDTISTAKRKDRDTLLGAFMASQQGFNFAGGFGDDLIVIGTNGGTVLPGNNSGSILPSSMASMV